MRPGALLLAALLVAAAIPTAQAALNSPRPYKSLDGYMDGLGGTRFEMVSGEANVQMPSSGGTYGFFATTGADVKGLTRVCWTQITRQCQDSPPGFLSLHIQPTGSFGLRLPTGVEATLTADHAIAMFADLSKDTDLNSLQVGRSLMAPVVAGQVRLESIPTIPDSAANDLQGTGAGVLVATDETTKVEVRNAGLTVTTLTGKTDPVTFAGRPTLGAVSCQLALLPFDGPNAVARFTKAEPDAAKRGLDIPRINDLVTRVFQASTTPQDSSGLDENAFGPFADAAAAMFGGAVLRVPTQNATGDDIGFARISRLEVRGTTGHGLVWEGRASFEVRDGHVTGAKTMIGFGVFQLPWWSWALWILGIAAFIVRLVRKPDKTHPRWDRFKWIGWVASPLAFLLTFWLWDLEFRSLFGLSLFSGHASGQVLIAVAALQIVTWLAASFAAIAPLRLLLKNVSFIFHQGTFMGLSGAVASLLGFLFIATYLRAFLDVIVAPVLAGIS